MKLSNKLSSKLNAAKTKLQSSFGAERVKWVDINTLQFDEDFKAMFKQEEDKVERIVSSMITSGFDVSQPLIILPDGRIIDGNSRYLAATKAGIRFVPVIIKEFSSKDEALKYELHLQLDRRNLTDAEIIKAFQKLESMKAKAKAEGKPTEEFTDENIGKKINKSPRQVQKLRELSKKADSEILDKVAKGDISINQAYSEIKKTEKPAEQPTKAKVSANSKAVNSAEFIEGVKFALDELAMGKTAEDILASL